MLWIKKNVGQKFAILSLNNLMTVARTPELAKRGITRPARLEPVARSARALWKTRPCEGENKH